MATVITSKDGIAYAQLCAQIGALGMEINGLRRRGRSVYSIVKQQYNIRGTRVNVLAQLEVMRDQRLAALRPE